MTTISAPVHSSEALVERMFNAALAAFDIYGMYLGERLGLYSCLAKHGAQTPREFAENAGIDERYGREWLEQQAASAILEYADGRFSLPAAHLPNSGSRLSRTSEPTSCGVAMSLSERTRANWVPALT